MLRQSLLTGLLLLGLSATHGQECPELNKINIREIKQDIGYLADDKLKGREPGTEGAKLAADYIKSRFDEMGLQPEEDDYFQHFQIPDQVSFGAATRLKAGGEAELFREYYPVQYSSNASAQGKTVFVKYGITATEMKYDDYAGFEPEDLKAKVFVMDLSSPDGIHPHSAYLRYHDLGDRIEKAKSKGAVAVILVNREGMASDISPEFTAIHDKGLPVVFVPDEKLAKKLVKGKKVKITTELKEQKIDAFNVVAKLDNGARKTVVIGAHYDHLGMGGKTSLYTGEPAIHNGADDNASGVAGLLQIAEYISGKREKFQNTNFIFIAFSGEERGLLGSGYFAGRFEEGASDLKYMLNLDMVGRLENNLLAVNGVGTSPMWEEIIARPCNELELKTSKSGVGPSDHTSFYNIGIPVLHFFTGTHSDYHKPTDDADRINYEGTAQVVEYILSIIEKSQMHPEMEFSKTASNQSSKAPKFSVTLGVMPDYMYEGEGMRIDGVTEGRPASEAGLQAGDVVIHLGEVKVVDMTSYMKALGQFKKGDKAPITYQRNGKTISTKVQF